MSKKEFLAEVDRIRRNMQSKANAFVDESRVAARKRRVETEKDFEVWKQTYLPHYFFKPSGEIHKELHEICSTGNKSLNAVGFPREHGKSVNCTFAELIYKAVTLISRYSIIISDIFDTAKDFLEFIKFEFEENPRLRNDYGKDGELKTGGWWEKGDIVITTAEGQARIRAMGAQQKIRGTRFFMWRPMYIVVDDLENNLNVKNKKLVQERFEWLLGAVYGSMDDDGSMIMIGTMIDKICVLKKMVDHILDSKEKIERRFGIKAMNAVVYSAIKEDGTALWPEGKSLQKLLQIKASIPEKVWLCEYMNKPPDGGIFKLEFMRDFDREIIVYANTKYSFFSGSDPSALDNETNDYKSHVIVAKHPERPKWFVVDAWIQKDTPSGMINKFIEFYRVYNMVASAFESNGYQVMLKDELEKICLVNGIFPTIVPVIHTTNKIARISSLQGMVQRQEIMFDRDIPDVEKLVFQLNQLGGRAHDDGPDAFQMAMEVSLKYSGDFNYKSAGKRAMANTIERETRGSLGRKRFAAGLMHDYMGVHI